MKSFASLLELRQALDIKQISAVELARDHLDRVRALNPLLNCLITIDEEGAVEAAERADARIAKGQIQPLTGIPLAHKDLFCTNGVRTTCASRMLASFISPYDATVVERIGAQGGVCLGKTNMDEFAMGSSNETSYFGPVANPWDVRCSPGGSSGGSAAAVAAGLVPLATGTDTGGSIRQPAGFCGVTGLKPTYGRVSRFGMIAFASSLDQGGPIACSATDAGFLLAAMEGHDPRDSTSATARETDLQGGLDRKRLGFPSQLFANLDKEMAIKIDDARHELEKLGYEFIDIDLPHLDAAIAAYYVISGAEASANLARFDGVRYGHRALSPVDLNDLYCRSRSEGFGTEVKRRILTGTYALSVGYFDAYYLKAQKIRRLVRQDFWDAFDNVDAIVAPVTPTTAFQLGSLSKDPIAMYRQDIFTIPVSLAGLPALSLPCGFVDGLPIGMQIIGNHFDESTVLGIGRTFQTATNWHDQHPSISDSG